MTRKKVILSCVLITISICVLTVGAYAARLYYIAKIDPLSAFASGTERLPPTNTPAESTPQAPTSSPTPTMTQTQAPTTTPTPTPTPTDTPTPSPQGPTIDREFNERRVNILMLGWDRSPERTNKSSSLYRDEKNNYRSDVMMLLSIDFDNSIVDMVSIPRDSYAAIYNTKGKWKINAAFAKGGSAEKDGFDYAMNTISMLFGDIPIKYYVGVDMDGLKAVVDAMGGVDFAVDVEFTLNGRKTEPGYQHLDGQQVLDYCRARKNIHGGESSDLGRIDRQQRVLFAIFEQLQQADQLLNVPKIYTSLSDKIYTNMNVEQMTALAGFATSLSMDNLKRHTLKGQMLDAYGAQFFVLDQTYKNQLVQDIFGFTPKFDYLHDINYVKSGKKVAAKPATTPPPTPKPAVVATEKPPVTITPNQTAQAQVKNETPKTVEPKTRTTEHSIPEESTPKPSPKSSAKPKADDRNEVSAVTPKPTKQKATPKPKATSKPKDSTVIIPDENDPAPNMLGD